MPRKSRQNLDLQLIELLARGSSGTESARAAGCDPKTVYRKLQDPEFKAAVEEFRSNMLYAASGHLACVLKKAISTLEELLTSSQPSIQLGAARAILDSSLKVREAVEIESRIRILEEACRIGQGGATNHAA